METIETIETIASSARRRAVSSASRGSMKTMIVDEDDSPRARARRSSARDTARTSTTMRATTTVRLATAPATFDVASTRERGVGSGPVRRRHQRHQRDVVVLGRRGDASVTRASSESDDDATSPSKSADDTLAALDAMLPASEETPSEPEVVETPSPRARKAGEISPEMRKKLLGESVGLGGLPEKPMPSNIFLNIILGVLAIVVVAYVGGIRP